MSNSRRGFLKASTAGIAAGTLSGKLTSSIAATDEQYDVIVIGGGFAGVTAARETSNRGAKTLLLEARPRLGGRTFTLPLANHHLDLGGTWVGWAQPHVWSELMRYELDIVERASSKVVDLAVWLDDGKRMEAAYEKFAPIFESTAEKYYQPAQAAFPRPYQPLFKKGFEELDSMSAMDAINDIKFTPAERNVALALAAINGHSSPADSSYLDQLRWYPLGHNNVWTMFSNLGNFRIKGGTKTLIDRIADDSKAKVKFNTPISSISQNKDLVSVTSKSGDHYVAKKLIVATPLNCWDDLEFSPALSPEKTRVATARHTGSGTKVYIKTTNTERMVECVGRDDTPFCFLWTEYDDKDSQILVGFGASKDLLDINSGAAVEKALHQFLPEAKMQEFYTYDWNVDPYAQGTWCMYRPNVLTQDFKALQAAEGNIFFANGDIANGWRGFIDGAIECGLREGRRVAELVQKH